MDPEVKLPDTATCFLCQDSALAVRTPQSPRYFHCPCCGMIFLSPENHLSPEGERTRYEQHQNDPSDIHYRQFLARLVDPLLDHLKPGARGLDYGSGPGPALIAMLREHGCDMRGFDPFFDPDASALETRYDFITCTEVIEHFHRPLQEFTRLSDLLLPNGTLAVMTETLTDDTDFANWHYRRDPTHTCFYHARTFEWIADHFGYKLDRPHKNVALFVNG